MLMMALTCAILETSKAKRKDVAVDVLVRSQMTVDGSILGCLACGAQFHRKGYSGIMDWATHICQPMTMTNYTGSWKPMRHTTIQGQKIEYRWVCAVPVEVYFHENR